MRRPFREALLRSFAVSCVASCLLFTAACGGPPDESQAGEEAVGQTHQPLWSEYGFQVGPIAIEQGKWHHYGPFPVIGPYGTTNPVFSATLTPLSGNPDLYLRKNSRPFFTVYDCRSKRLGTSIEYCASNDSADVYVSVFGYVAGSYSLRIANSSNLGVWEVSKQGEQLYQGDWAFYGPFRTEFQTWNGAWLTPTAGDPDLYVKRTPANIGSNYAGYLPTVSSYDCRPYAGGQTAEFCTVFGPIGEIVGVRGYATGLNVYNIDIRQY